MPPKNPRKGSVRKLTGTGSTPLGDTPRATQISLKAEEVSSIREQALQSIAGKMNLKVSDLPKSITSAVDEAVQTVMDTRAKALIQRDVDSAVKSRMMVGVDAAKQLGARMQAASQGLSIISQDASVDKVLRDTAKLLWKKFDCLKTAGFTEEQAFSLLQAEVAGRAGRSR
jgi:hypothetical protein